MGGTLVGVRCPHCQSDRTRVVDSRPAEQHAAIRRRRECEDCRQRFTTYERVVPVLLVKKRSGRLEPFSPEKLRRGVAAALADRPVPDSRIAQLVEEVEVSLQGRSSPVSSERIGREVLERLRALDEVAYLRFASVYKDFQAVQDFERELASLEEVSSQRPTGRGRP